MNCLFENENMCHYKDFTNIFVLNSSLVLLVNGLSKLLRPSVYKLSLTMCEYACIDFDSFKSQGALRLSVVKPKPN